jgi:hypothetical protein
MTNCRVSRGRLGRGMALIGVKMSVDYKKSPEIIEKKVLI